MELGSSCIAQLDCEFPNREPVLITSFRAEVYKRRGPTGTKLCPLLFLIMINDLAGSDETIKFVDDTTLWEITTKDSSTHLPATVSSCSEWSLVNNMKSNISKTKELCIYFLNLTSSYLPLLSMMMMST